MAAPYATFSRPSPIVFAILAALVLLAYLPALSQPLIEDDYPNIALAQIYGPPSGWHELFQNPVFRVRATTWGLMYGVNRLFGMQASAYYGATILLQVLNTWLLYSLGAWQTLGYRLTAWAAAFFAVYEGHQEAIMWLSGSTEPLLLFFGLISLLSWILFLDGRHPLWYAASILAFLGALLSKESAVVLLPLLALPVVVNRRPWRTALFLIPHASLAGIAVLSILLTRTYSFRFQDGSFSLHAPFWLTWPSSFVRLFWFWGMLSVIAILVWKPNHYRRTLAISTTWIGISLAPYSFLTYMTRIPSRQTHLASVGVALVVGFALVALYDRYWASHRALVILICAAIVIHNVGYLWTKKRAQFLARAAPTEQLIAVARRAEGPIYVQCFPRTPLIAEAALQLMTGRPAADLVWNAAEARRRHATTTFCYPNNEPARQ
jgi:Zn-dependent membrane protease YugP